jgi:hypothetical protein
LVLSRFQPEQALKNQVARGKNAGSALLRKILTVFQFSFSQALIVGTLIVSLQIKFMLEKDLGFDTDAILKTRGHGARAPGSGRVGERALLLYDAN